MTQRIFDMDNPQDVKDLFDILPDAVEIVYKDTPSDEIELYDKNRTFMGSCGHIRVNWHDKVQITRPVDESDWIGCLCWFWNYEKDSPGLGHLKAIDDQNVDYKYIKKETKIGYKNCRPVRRGEIKFVGDVE